MTKLLCFDLETSKQLPVGCDLKAYMPLSIAVVAAVTEDGDKKVWHAVKSDGTPARSATPEIANEVIEYLLCKQAAGYQICGWNCIGFDLFCLASLAGDYERCAQLARSVYDPMYQFFVLNGFPVGLESVASVMVPGLTKVMPSVDIPARWINGEHDIVIKHALRDCEMTIEVIKEINQCSEVVWKKRDGKVSSRDMPSPTNGETVMAMAMADQAWMSKPIQKWEYTYWIPRKYLPPKAAGCKKPFELLDIVFLPIACLVMAAKKTPDLARKYPNFSMAALAVAIAVVVMLFTVGSIETDGVGATLGLGAVITLEAGALGFVLWLLHRRSGKR